MNPSEYFRILTSAALVDGDLDPDEVPHLKQFARRLELSSEAASEILDQVRQGHETELRLPSRPKERRMLFRHAARIVAADGRLTDAELDLLSRIGASLDLDRQAVLEAVQATLPSAEPPAPAAAPATGAPPEVAAAKKESASYELAPQENGERTAWNAPQPTPVEAVEAATAEPEGLPGVAEVMRGDLLLVVSTYLWQVAGVILLGLTYFAGNRGSFVMAFCGGALAFALGFTIRRCDDPDRWALPLTWVVTVVMSFVQSVAAAITFAVVASAALAMIYHGEMIGAYFLNVNRYSGIRSTPVHGGCVRVVGYLGLVAAAGYFLWVGVPKP